MANRLPQPQLAIELRMACDAAMIVDPVRGADAAAMKRVRRLLETHPNWHTHSHLRHNLGARRMAWLRAVEQRWTAA